MKEFLALIICLSGKQWVHGLDGFITISAEEKGKWQSYMVIISTYYLERANLNFFEKLVVIYKNACLKLCLV